MSHEGHPPHGDQHGHGGHGHGEGHQGGHGHGEGHRGGHQDGHALKDLRGRGTTEAPVFMKGEIKVSMVMVSMVEDMKNTAMELEAPVMKGGTMGSKVMVSMVEDTKNTAMELEAPVMRSMVMVEDMKNTVTDQRVSKYSTTYLILANSVFFAPVRELKIHLVFGKICRVGNCLV
ncbi:hypothetical protein CJ030_MR5G010501 [Morella rubra]|uniref:Uncharacterized protein n=1 Tax=Morella rubra TaxID=262757 RepID=A0A6A1VSA9_9ROSI|nr:hypothetical protein CJ030_MR5G010501 [Morella rubra]